MQDVNAKEILNNMLEKELNWIASLSHFSDKKEVKEKAVKWILHSFNRDRLIVKYGSGGIRYEDLITDVKKTNVYRFASVVDAAETEREFIRLILDEWADDTATQSIILTRPWRKVRNLFQINWNFRFPYPKEKDDQPVFRRNQHRTPKAKQEPIQAPSERPWTDYIPEEYREIVQLASNLPKDNLHIVKMLAKETKTFQRTLIKTILLNPYNEEAVHEWAIRVNHEGRGQVYEMRIRNISLEIIKAGVKL